MLKGRFLQQNWMTSLNHSALNIHRIDHDNTKLTPWPGTLVLVAIIPSLCGQEISSKWLALLDDQDAYMWTLNHGELYHRYGTRKQCKWCG